MRGGYVRNCLPFLILGIFYTAILMRVNWVGDEVKILEIKTIMQSV